jgi:UDP-N-acetylmuramate--alanine ligase
MNIHFIGIGGIGLSALARLLKYNGHSVSGSDMSSTTVTQALENEGIVVNVPHKKDVIKNQDLIIYSAAVKQSNVEILQAYKKDIKVIPRKEALSIALADTKNYCVCGAHGKSTTTAILTSILQSSALIGAISKEFGSNFRYKNETIAFEADESDGSFLLSNPYCAIVPNAEPEHMEYYNYDLDRFYGAYEQFLKMATIRVINAEDDFLKTLTNLDAIRLYPSKDIKNIAFTIKENEPYTTFELKDLGHFEVWGFGYHIAIDASLAILSALNEIGLDNIKENLKNYKGIKKRFDIIYKNDKLVVIDDYAHHPTEIEATIKSVNLYKELIAIDKIVAIWQPHKYSRLVSNLEHFKSCFNGCSELIILPVWNVGEKEANINLEYEFASYNPVLVDKIIKKDDKIALQKDGKIIKVYDEGIILGLGAGDITYQLRGYKNG